MMTDNIADFVKDLLMYSRNITPYKLVIFDFRVSIYFVRGYGNIGRFSFQPIRI